MIIQKISNTNSNINNYSNSYRSFKSNKAIESTVSKKSYIDLKTQELENISAVTFIMSILSGVTNVDFNKDKLGAGKLIALGLGLVSLGTLIAKIIKSINLGKEFDNMQRSKNDSKN